MHHGVNETGSVGGNSSNLQLGARTEGTFAGGIASVFNIGTSVISIFVVALDLLVLIVLYKTKLVPFQIKFLSANLLLADCLSALMLVVHQGLIYIFQNKQVLILASRILSTGIFLGVSWASVATISVERVLALSFALSYYKHCKSSNIVVCVIVVWIINISLPVGVTLGTNTCTSEQSQTCGQFTVSKGGRYTLFALQFTYMTILTVCYVIISRIVRRHAVQISVLQPNSTENRGNRLKSTKSITIVLATFIVLHTPYIIHFWVRETLPQFETAGWRQFFHYISYMCIQANTCISPLIYVMNFKECRYVFLKTFCSWNDSIRVKLETMRLDLYDIVQHSTSTQRTTLTSHV